MYHNEGGGKFRDVSESLGFNREGWAQGVCVGDYDYDGNDRFLRHLLGTKCALSQGRGRFEDVTTKVHLTQDRVRYNTGCAFVDFDNDGKLDLFVANYLKFNFNATPKPGANPYCFYRGIAVNSGPCGLPFDRNILYRNDGGVFRDVYDERGASKPNGNYLVGGKSVDEALIRGAAIDDNGKALSGHERGGSGLCARGLSLDIPDQFFG
jgi:enediyne biosynthesis protein E4